MEKIFKDLANSKLIRITGSYADGTYNDDSDIDLYIKPDNPEWRWKQKERHIDTIKKILDRYGIEIKSNQCGHIYTTNLSIQLEFSDRFKPRKGKLKEVNLFGYKFKTY
jgi:predicted nucleotidyltransferase